MRRGNNNTMKRSSAEYDLDLTQKEEELMNLLWDSEGPMSSIDMLDADYPRTWKNSYLIRLLLSLQEKHLILIDSIELQGKNFVRKFVPALTREKFTALLAVSKIKKERSSELLLNIAKEVGNKQIESILVALTGEKEDDSDEDVIGQLEEIIKELKEREQ